MAQTDAGHKFIRVPAHTRQTPSDPVKGYGKKFFS